MGEPNETKYHPAGVAVEVFGIENGNRGRSCEDHDVCGSVLCLDSVVRIRLIQIVNGIFHLR